MAVRFRGGKFVIDHRHMRPDGTIDRVRITCPPDMQSKRAAHAYHAMVLADLARGIDPRRSAAPEAARAPTLADFANEYLKHCETNNRAQYARSKAKIMRRVILPFFGAMPMDSIGPREIQEYRSARSKDVAAKTVNNEIGILLHALSTARDFELVDRVPKVRPLKATPPDVEYLRQDEQDRLVGAARSEGGPWAAMIIIGLRTGLRLGELRALRWKDVDTVAGRIMARVAADDENAITPPKSGKPREVPLGDDAIVELRAHKHMRGPLVFCEDDGSILTAHRCRWAMDRLMRKAGLATGDGQWHLLRHTFASELVMRGATLKAVQELLGHSSLAMVLRYAHLSPDHRRDAVRLLDRGGGQNLVNGSGKPARAAQ